MISIWFMAAYIRAEASQSSTIGKEFDHFCQNGAFHSTRIFRSTPPFSSKAPVMPNLNLNRWQISRRQMLRGLGASISLPWLNAMGTLPAPSQPKRSVFLYIPNGVNTLTWQIAKAGTDYEFTKPLASLEKHRADITPISGLHHPMVIGKHHNCEKVWLTGANVPGDGGAFRNTVSADQLIAETIGAATRFPSLELAIEGQ